MDTFLQDVRVGLRALRKQPGFTAIVVTTLGLAIGVNTLIFSFVNFFVLRPLPFKDMDSLVSLSGSHPDQGSDRVRVSYADFLDWRAAARSLSDLAAFGDRSFNLTGAGEPLRVKGRLASASLFRLWGLETVLGRPILPEDDRAGAGRVALLAHGFWERRFGSERDVLGRSVTLDGEAYTIVGVLTPEIEIGNFSEIEVWVPIALHARPDDRTARSLRVVGRLAPGVELPAAAAELRALALRQQREHPETHAGWSVQLVTLRASLSSANTWIILALMSVAVSFVLAIACANVANLMLARGTALRRASAVRAALGATRWRLARQLLTEGALLSLLGGGMGLLLAQWGLAIIRSVTFEQFFQLVVIDRRVLAFSGATSLLAPLVFGLLPALRSSREDLVRSLRDGGARTLGDHSGGRSRRALVVIQVALAASLLVVAGLVLRSAFALQFLDPGYDVKGLLTLRIALPQTRYDHDDKTRALVSQLLAGLRAAPATQALALGSSIPGLEGVATAPLAIEGLEPRDGSAGPQAVRSVVSAGYLAMLGIPLLAGRDIGESDSARTLPVVVVSRSLASRYLAGRDPIGARLRLGPVSAGEPWREVVGVAEDVLNANVNQPALPQAYLPFEQAPTRTLVVFLRTREVEATLALARTELARLDGTLALYDARAVERAIYEDLASNRVITGLFVAFGAVALGLATIGLYGVISYSVAQRTREFGVRVALGAQAGDVLRLVLGQGAWMISTGLALGLAAGAALARTVAGILYGVTASDPLTFGGVLATLGTAGFLATLAPAIRALRVDPMTALRAE